MRADLPQPVRAKWPTLHYGWIILGAGTFGSFMTLPGQTAGVSVFFDPITTELGISRTTASIAYAAGTLAGILPAPIIGRWIDRRGPRSTATIIAGALALACAFMACVQSALTLLIGFALLRGAAIGGLSLVSQQVVNLWFVRRRGIAAATASLGLAAGSMAFPQAIDFLIALFGWRGAYLALAGFVALTILPVAALLFRDRPEKYGLSPDAGLALTAKDPRPEPSFSRQQALRTGVFWLLCAAGFLTNAVGTALLLNHFSIMQAAGVAYVDALAMLALVGGVQAIATIGTGILVDRHEPRRLVPLAMGMLALASALPAFGGGVAMSWLYALNLGGAYGAQQAINAAGYAQYFGRDHLGAIRGTSFVFGVAGAALGPLPFAASMDWTESYAAVLIVCFGLSSLRGGRFHRQLPACARKQAGKIADDRANHMTGGETTVVAGIEIPSTDPVFLTIIFAIHIPLGLACVGTGAIAMLSEKRRGRHSTFGTIYFWCLVALFASATFLSLMRWAENYHLFILGAMSLASAWGGRTALRRRWRDWVRLHITGMGLSYTLMLVAFYVDNGKQLPGWKELPHFMYWAVPLAVGIPLIIRALLWHPLARLRA